MRRVAQVSDKSWLTSILWSERLPTNCVKKVLNLLILQVKTEKTCNVSQRAWDTCLWDPADVRPPPLFDVCNKSWHNKTRANNHSIILSIYNAVFGLIRQHTELSVKNKTAKDDVWWPFLKASYLDICTCKFSFEVEYPFCAVRSEQGRICFWPASSKSCLASGRAPCVRRRARCSVGKKKRYLYGQRKKIKFLSNGESNRKSVGQISPNGCLLLGSSLVAPVAVHGPPKKIKLLPQARARVPILRWGLAGLLLEMRDFFLRRRPRRGRIRGGTCMPKEGLRPLCRGSLEKCRTLQKNLVIFFFSFFWELITTSS